MANKIKKVDLKKVNKMEMSKLLTETLKANGYDVHEGEKFGMTAGTLVVKLELCDIQIKLITPKAGVDHYEELQEEEA